MNARFLLCRFIAFVFIFLSCSSSYAQGEPENAPKGALSKALDVATIAAEPKSWPREVTLLSPVRLPLVLNGTKVGETQLPAGKSVVLRKVNLDGTVEVEFQGSSTSIQAAGTDLSARACAASASSEAEKKRREAEQKRSDDELLSHPIAAVSDISDIAKQPKVWPQQVALLANFKFRATDNGPIFQMWKGNAVILRAVNSDGTVEVEDRGQKIKISAEYTDVVARARTIAGDLQKRYDALVNANKAMEQGESSGFQKLAPGLVEASPASSASVQVQHTVSRDDAHPSLTDEAKKNTAPGAAPSSSDKAGNLVAARPAPSAPFQVQRPVPQDDAQSSSTNGATNSTAPSAAASSADKTKKEDDTWIWVLSIYVGVLILFVILHQKEVITLYRDYTDVGISLGTVVLGGIAAVTLLSSVTDSKILIAARWLFCGLTGLFLFASMRASYFANQSFIRALLSMVGKLVVNILALFILFLVVSGGNSTKQGDKETDAEYAYRKKAEARAALEMTLFLGAILFGLGRLCVRYQEFAPMGWYFSLSNGKEFERGEEPAELEDMFIECLCGMVSKLTLADGGLSGKEWAAMKSLLVQTLELNQEECRAVRGRIDELSHTPSTFEDFVAEFDNGWGGEQASVGVTLDILEAVCQADGKTSAAKAKLMEVAYQLFSVEPAYVAGRSKCTT